MKELKQQLEEIIETSFELHLNDLLEDNETWFNVQNFAEQTADYISDNYDEFQSIDIIQEATDYINLHGEELFERIVDYRTEEENLRYEHPIT